MGLGEDETILIPCDENSRMKTEGEFDFVVFSKRKNVKITFCLKSCTLSLFFCLELFREYFEVTSITILGIQRLPCGGVALFVTDKTKVLLVSLSI